MNVQSFEDLRIWQQARELVKVVYLDFGAGTASERDFGFRNQIQRAGVSTMNNIAEGFERDSDREFSHFLSIAKGSCGEVRSMVYTAEDLAYLTSELAIKHRERARQISSGIAALRRHLNRPASDTP